MSERHRNDGLRKRCGCPRTSWGKCRHPWHLNYKWKGKHYRLSLDREGPDLVRTRGEARLAADKIRQLIRAGTFQTDDAAAAEARGELTFTQFAALWKEAAGKFLVRPRENDYRLGLIEEFVLPGSDPPITIGNKLASAITVGDIEAFRAWRRTQGLSTVTVNHDLKLLRKMFNWGIRTGYLEATPFKRASVTTIHLEREIPRSRRFHSEEDEQKLLQAASPHLHAVIVAMLETACRPGEILSLQWADVNLERGELTIRAAKSKTRTERTLPISARLRAVLEMRRTDPTGEEHGPDAYVFGDELGREVKTVRDEWEKAREAAGLGDFHLADLRHEAASRFEEFGMPTLYVSQFLGHTNLTTTTRYLNSTRRGLHWAMRRFEDERKQRAEEQKGEPESAPAAVAHPLHTAAQPTGQPVSAAVGPVPPKLLIS